MLSAITAVAVVFAAVATPVCDPDNVFGFVIQTCFRLQIIACYYPDYQNVHIICTYRKICTYQKK